MGMYDYILGQTRCGFCNHVHTIDEQIKFPMDRCLNLYIIGDKIDVSDGEYNYLSGCRNPVYACEQCGNHNEYAILVKDGILAELRTEKQSQDVVNETMKRLREEAKIKQQEWFNDIMNHIQPKPTFTLDEEPRLQW